VPALNVPNSTKASPVDTAVFNNIFHHAFLQRILQP
jgi:hypothetical protein